MAQIKLKHIALSILSIVAMLSFCYFLRMLYAQAWLKCINIDNNIVPVDVFSLFISSAITIWVGYYVVKNLSEQRFEKEMLINDLMAIEKEIEQVESTFKTSRVIDLTYMSVKMDSIKQLIDRFSYTAKMSNNCIEKEISSINDSFYALYSASTNFDGGTMESQNIDCTSILRLTDDLIKKIRSATINLNKK